MKSTRQSFKKKKEFIIKNVLKDQKKMGKKKKPRLYSPGILKNNV